MNGILFYDTETTGKLDFKKAPDAPGQPRLVQLAAIMTDPEGNEIAKLKTIIKPDGWTIDPEAQKIHGISAEYAEQWGIPLITALMMFNALAARCKGYVCHNSDFDSQILAGEKIRAATNARMEAMPPELPHFCTMKAMTPICRIPGPYGNKWPKLQEAFKFCFQREFDGAHDALNDVIACKDIYFWMKNRQKAKAAATIHPAATGNAFRDAMADNRGIATNS